MCYEKKDGKHHYRLDHFDGPLDILLFLIRKNEVNIYDIPIAEITEQYLGFLDYTTIVHLEEVTEFYLMAATLLYIKSRILLPIEVDLDDVFEDPRDELVQQLIEYERIRKLTDLIAEREEQADWIIERKNSQTILPFPDEGDLWEQVKVWDLLKSFSKVMRGIGSEQFINLWEEVTINEKITLIQEFLDDKDEFFFDDLIVSPGAIMEVISAFLAVLELVKGGLIEIFQNHLFGDIKIKQSARAKKIEMG